MDKDILAEALEKFDESQTVSSHNRDEAQEDIRFARLADQWPKDIKKIRTQEGRPCLTINRLPTFIRQVTNEARRTTPGVKVRPVDNGADEGTAEVIGGLVRAIERKGGDVAKDTAVDHAVTSGFGFFRLEIDYVHPMSFEMECRFKRVPNPLMVHWDVNSSEADASDWEYAFVSEFYTKEQFEAAYPDADKVEFEGSTFDGVEHWLSDDNIRVAEYWERTQVKKKIVQLNNGRVVREEHLPDLAREVLVAGGMDSEIAKQLKDDEVLTAASIDTGLEAVRERESTFNEVTRRVISGADVLEESKWPGSTIPICPVLGDEVYSEGRRHFRSLIRDARDPQQMFNYWRSASTELVALAPRAPFIGPKGFVPKGHEEKWATANTRSHAHLEYEGQAAPQRQPFAGVPAGAIQEALNASDDIKAITGIYDSSLGARSNETSGRAILARERQGDISNYHFVDNLNRAVEYAGRCLVEIIPHVYGAREAIRILGPDQKENVVNLTQENPGEFKEDGERKLYNLGVGTYDVTVESGPNFATQREETREALLEILRVYPAAAPFIGPMLLRHMDVVGADDLADKVEAVTQPQPGLPGQPAQPGLPGQPVPPIDPAQAGFFNGGNTAAQ
tara:strand:+ start:3327 stop:5189 length:1863 start_codon:yes stop_codon:yes gene_type:complete